MVGGGTKEEGKKELLQGGEGGTALEMEGRREGTRKEGKGEGLLCMHVLDRRLMISQMSLQCGKRKASVWGRLVEQLKGKCSY